MTSAKIVLKTVLAAAVLSCASGAEAQSLIGSNTSGVAGGQLQISGNAPESCVITTPAQGAIANATFTAGPNSAQVTITQLVDPTTAVPQAATIDMLFPVVCNTAHTLTISTAQGGLVLQAAAPPPGAGFRNRLDYQVNANWVGQQVSGTSAAPLQISSPDAATGQLDVSIAIPAGGEPLEAGAYSDSLIVNIQPTG